METHKVDASAPGFNPPASPWAAWRREGLTSTDAADIMGQGYGSRLQVWLDKKGLLPPLEESEAMYWGTKLEPLLVTEFERRTAHGVLAFGPTEAVNWPGVSAAWPLDERRSPRLVLQRLDASWARATPDAHYKLGWTTLNVLAWDHLPTGLLECKTTAFRNGDAWREQPPLAAQIQAQWQLYVSGLEHGALVCLIGGQRFVGYEFTRNEPFIAHMAEEAERFWVDYVLADREPAADERDLEVVRDLAGARPGLTVELPAEAEHIDAMLLDAQQQERLAGNRVDAYRAQIIRWLGEAEYGRVPGSHIFYRLHKYDRAGSEVRQLRRIVGYS